MPSISLIWNSSLSSLFQEHDEYLYFVHPTGTYSIYLRVILCLSAYIGALAIYNEIKTMVPFHRNLIDRQSQPLLIYFDYVKCCTSIVRTDTLLFFTNLTHLLWKSCSGVPSIHEQVSI